MNWINSTSQSIYLNLRYNAPLMLIIGIFTTWAIERVFEGFLQQRMGPLRVVGAILALILVVLLYRLALWAMHGRRQNQGESVGVAPNAKRGLILIYSNQETAQMAVAPHRETLDFIWFIVTDESRAMLSKQPRHWWGRAVRSSEKVHNVYDPTETANAIDRAVSHADVLKLMPAEMVCDVTGGTKAMSIGAVAACSGYPDLTVQMVPANRNPNLDHPHPLMPIVIETGTEIRGVEEATEGTIDEAS